MTSSRLADVCWSAALVTLPGVGIGVVRVVTGRDLGAGFQPAYLLLAAAIALQGVRLLRGDGRAAWRRTWRRPPAAGLGRAGGLVAGALILSALGVVIAPAVDPSTAWSRYARQIAQMAVMACFVIYPALWTRGEERWRRVLLLVAIGLVGQEIYSLVQGVDHWWPVPGYAAAERIATSNPAILSGSDELFLGGRFRGLPRLRGTMCEPLYLGSFLLLAVPVAALLAPRGRGLRLAAAAGAVLLLLTWSRGALLAGVAAGAVWLAARRRAGFPVPVRRVVLAAIGTFALVAVIAAVAEGPAALGWPFERMLQSFDRQDWSNLTRLFSMQAAWRAFQLSPVVGIGWGQYAYHFPLLVDPLGLQSQFTWPVVNSYPLEVLCETGVIGFAVLVVLSAVLVGRTWRLLPVVAPHHRRRLLALAAAGTGIGLQLLTFSQYNLPHLGVALGLWVAAVADADTAPEAS